MCENGSEDCSSVVERAELSMNEWKAGVTNIALAHEGDRPVGVRGHDHRSEVKRDLFLTTCRFVSAAMACGWLIRSALIGFRASHDLPVLLWLVVVLCWDFISGWRAGAWWPLRPKAPLRASHGRGRSGRPQEGEGADAQHGHIRR